MVFVISGFPKTFLPHRKVFYGYQTGDMVCAKVTAGKKLGIHVGRVSCKSDWYFFIKTRSETVTGVHVRYIHKIQAEDGYVYHTEQRNS